MEQLIQPKEVVVDRKLGFGRGAVLERIVATCHEPVFDEDGKPAVDSEGRWKLGEFTGFYALESGVYAHEKQARDPAPGEADALREREALAAVEFLHLRDEMWGGGGRVVYTE